MVNLLVAQKSFKSAVPYFYKIRKKVRCILFLLILIYSTAWSTEVPANSLVEVVLDDHAGYVTSPSMALSPDGTVYIVYEEEQFNSRHITVKKKIWARWLNRNSKQFSKAKLLHWSTDLGATDIYIDRINNVHLIWSDAQACKNSNMVGHNVILYYQKYSKELLPLAEPIQLTPECSRGSSFGFENNSLSTDSSGNTHILHQLGYFIVGAKGERLHTERYDFEHSSSSYPYRSDIKSDASGNTYLAWFVRNSGMGGVTYIRTVHSSEGDQPILGTIQRLFELERGDVKRIAVIVGDEEVIVQVDEESCSSMFTDFLNSFLTPRPPGSDPLGQDKFSTRVYKFSKEGVLLGTESMPLCGYIENRAGQLWAHYIPMASFSCAASDMEIHYSSAIYGETPSPYKQVISIRPYPSSDHGPAFWDEQVQFDQQGGVHLAWYLNNGLNRYKVYYVELNQDGIPVIPVMQVAP